MLRVGRRQYQSQSLWLHKENAEESWLFYCRNDSENPQSWLARFGTSNRINSFKGNSGIVTLFSNWVSNVFGPTFYGFYVGKARETLTLYFFPHLHSIFLHCLLKIFKSSFSQGIEEGFSLSYLTGAIESKIFRAGTLKSTDKLLYIDWPLFDR